MKTKNPRRGFSLSTRVQGNAIGRLFFLLLLWALSRPDDGFPRDFLRLKIELIGAG